jgi:hypothetical protein
MDDLDFLVFTHLFKEAYEKCFGYALKSPLTETESKLFCNKVLDQTGLSIGWKSVKNYREKITKAITLTGFCTRKSFQSQPKNMRIFNGYRVQG